MAETLRLSEKEAGDPFPGPSRLELWVTLLWCDSFPWTSENFPFLGSTCQGFYSKWSPLDGPSGTPGLHSDLELNCILTREKTDGSDSFRIDR